MKKGLSSAICFIILLLCLTRASETAILMQNYSVVFREPKLSGNYPPRANFERIPEGVSSLYTYFLTSQTVPH